MNSKDYLIGFENESHISFEQFRAWMHGLIQGKKGALPDIDDWKHIKKMMEKVDPSLDAPKTIPVPYPVPSYPCNPPPFFPPYITSPGTDGHPLWRPGDVWIGDSTGPSLSKWEITSQGPENGNFTVRTTT